MEYQRQFGGWTVRYAFMIHETFQGLTCSLLNSPCHLYIYCLRELYFIRFRGSVRSRCYQFHSWADIAYHSALAELFRPQIKTSSIPFECGWVALLSVFEIGMCLSLCPYNVLGADVGFSRCCHQRCCEWTSNALSRKK